MDEKKARKIADDIRAIVYEDLRKYLKNPIFDNNFSFAPRNKIKKVIMMLKAVRNQESKGVACEKAK